MSSTLRKLLEEHEAKLLDRQAELQRALVPVERELADARRALAAIAPDTVFERPAVGGEASRASVEHFARQAVVGRDVEQSHYAKMTMKQLVKKALIEHFHNGATANQLLDFFRDAWGRDDILRTSLSPQLSRLKDEGEIRLDGLVWTLIEPTYNFPSSDFDELLGGTTSQKE
jgi:hypothetical protein